MPNHEPGRPEVRGDFAERRKPHFDRAVKLTDASGRHNRLCTDRYNIPPQYGIGLSGSAGGIEPADVLLSLHKAVALLRATLPVISVLSVAVLPTISIPGAHYGPTALVESLRKRSNEPYATHIPVAATNEAG